MAAQQTHIQYLNEELAHATVAATTASEVRQIDFEIEIEIMKRRMTNAEAHQARAEERFTRIQGLEDEIANLAEKNLNLVLKVARLTQELAQLRHEANSLFYRTVC